MIKRRHTYIVDYLIIIDQDVSLTMASCARTSVYIDALSLLNVYIVDLGYLLCSRKDNSFRGLKKIENGYIWIYSRLSKLQDRRVKNFSHKMGAVR